MCKTVGSCGQSKKKKTDQAINTKRENISCRQCKSIYIPILTDGHELYVVTKGLKSQIQTAETGFLWLGVALERVGGA